MKRAMTTAILLASIARIQSFAPLPVTMHIPPSQSSSSTTKMSYATTIDHPPPGASDFARRMRNIALPKPPPKNKKFTSGRPNNIIEVTSLEDYKREVADEHDKIVAVRFFAPWCKSCARAAPSFYRVARELENTVKFVDVPVTRDTSKIHQGLQIPAIPYSHIYHPVSGLVEELRMSRKSFDVFEDALKSYVSGSCDVSEYDYSNPHESEVSL